MAACLASLLEISIEDVPELLPVPGDQIHWMEKFENFLEGYGIKAIVYLPTYRPPRGVYYLIWGVSPRGLPHSVVGRNGEVIHDPHPEGGGLASVDELVIFFPTFESAAEKQSNVTA